jgi:fatty-acyl-CoA synthase
MWEEFIDMGIQIDYHELETRQRTLSFDFPLTSNLPVVQLEVQRSNIKPSQHLKQRLYSSETQRITEEEK